MTLPETIQKAIDGGYHLYSTGPVEIHTNTWPMVTAYKNGIVKFWPLSNILLDPLFWKSLGKAMGWNLKYCSSCRRHHPHMADCDAGLGNDWPGWIFYWHSFIDHLASGKDIESFFLQF